MIRRMRWLAVAYGILWLALVALALFAHVNTYFASDLQWKMAWQTTTTPGLAPRTGRCSRAALALSLPSGHDFGIRNRARAGALASGPAEANSGKCRRRHEKSCLEA